MADASREPLIVVPLRASHLRAIKPQAAQSDVSDFMAKAGTGPWLTPGYSWAGLIGMEVMICAGLVPIYSHRAYAWSILAEGLHGVDFLKVHRAAVRTLDAAAYDRVEAYVDRDFAEGHRWIELLGFTWECTMRKFNPDGSDADLYARMR